MQRKAFSYVPHTRRNHWYWLRILFCNFLLLGFLFIVGIFIPFPSEPAIVEIQEGNSINEAIDTLERNGVLSFTLPAKILNRLSGTHVVAGYYQFDGNQSLYTVMDRLAEGDFGIERIPVTLPEGFTNMQIAERFNATLPHFDEDEFLSLASEYQGELFPSTYFFWPDASASSTFTALRDEFARQVEEKYRGVPAPVAGYTFEDVIKVAAILEREIPHAADRRIASDVLWRRLKAGRPLQVDATLHYILGKTSEELTISDLDIDSPYNTYKYPGLPPEPIANPGLDAIDAAFSPAPNKFWFFLSDDEGITHFSETGEEHEQKRREFLVE